MTVSPVPLASATLTVTDGDGDTATATVSFQVTDANTPTAGTASAAVDDDGLIGPPAGNPASTAGDLNANLAGDTNASEAVFSGVLGGSVGSDGAGANGFSFAPSLNGATATVGLETVTYGVAGNLLTATVNAGARIGTQLFTVEITNAATGAYTVTLKDNVLHAGGPNDEATDASVTLGYVITDADGSSAAGTLTVTFDDDAPTIGAIQDAVMPSIDDTGVHGTWQPVMGADGPNLISAIGLAMGSAPAGLTYVITSQGANINGDEIFQVDVKDGATTLYTFFEYTEHDAVTQSAEMFAYKSLTDAQGATGQNGFFTLTVAADGNYDFHLIDNSLQNTTTLDILADIPNGHSDYVTVTGGVADLGDDPVPASGFDLLIDGFTASNTDPTSNTLQKNNNGLGVGGGNFDSGETMTLAFANVQSEVTLGIGKGNNATFEHLLITIWDSTHTTSATWELTQLDGTPVIVDAAHWGAGGSTSGAFFDFHGLDIRESRQYGR